MTLDTRLLPDERDLAALCQQAHCFVLPTRAEGFGLPILEAMAAGLPVMVTNYRGPLDFCTADHACLVNVRGWVDSDPDCFPGIAGEWADPAPDHLVHLLRHVHANYGEAVAKAAAAHRAAHAHWTWERQLARVFP